MRVESIDDCLVFAGGDIVGNQHNGRGGTVIDAMGHGRLAAKNIDKTMSARETKWKTKKIILMNR